jgi:SAM-dependent methyltransferase
MADQNKIWHHFQRNCPESFKDAQPRMDYIIRQIIKNRGPHHCKILNIGIGSGYLEKRLKHLGQDVCTLDPDEETVRKFFEKGYKAYCGYIEKLPFNDSHFDFVVASEVLEHLNRDQFNKGLQEIGRVLTKSGWFLGTVPYNEDLLLNQVVCPECGYLFHRWGHLRTFDDRTLHQAMRPYFTTISMKKTAFVSFRNRGWHGAIKSCVRLILARCGSPIAVPNLFFAARKGQGA